VRKWIKWALALLVIVAALMILAPRVWVKNKRATVIVNGTKASGFSLYHGYSFPYGDQFLIERRTATQILIYVYVSDGDMFKCIDRGYANMRLLIIGRPSPCQLMRDARDYARSSNALSFGDGQESIRVTWHAPPR